MRFKKYSEIENSYRKKQEKAHGADLSFWYDGNELQYATQRVLRY